jgi:hypothetical protein
VDRDLKDVVRTYFKDSLENGGETDVSEIFMEKD